MARRVERGKKFKMIECRKVVIIQYVSCSVWSVSHVFDVVNSHAIFMGAVGACHVSLNIWEIYTFIIEVRSTYFFNKISINLINAIKKYMI
jgi:uncharacterized protein with PQ loop repeat